MVDWNWNWKVLESLDNWEKNKNSAIPIFIPNDTTREAFYFLCFNIFKDYAI